MMAPTSLVTVPEPAPDFDTVREKVGAGENVAVTADADVPTLIVHVPVPEQAPVHPAKTDAAEAGVAVRVTEVPLMKLAEHMEPQLMPAGALATEPDPDPASVTLIGNWAGMKFALTACAEVKVTVHVPTPEQPPPLQPANTEAAELGVAVNVTLAPDV